MYPLSDHGKMIADSRRINAYFRALEKSLKPGDSVLDIGTGTGIFALLACRLGAGRVYAVESSDIIQLAREIARVNGFEQNIEFIQKRFQELFLPGRVDLIVSDLRGVLPLFGRHLPLVADARRRFLKKGGRLIPRQDRLWAAVVNAPELYRRHTFPWEESPMGLNMRPARTYMIHSCSKGRVPPENLLTAPRVWATLDYDTLDDPDIKGRMVWSDCRRETGHGLLVWFDSILTDGITLSNAPDQPELIYGCAFLPWETPVPLTSLDSISVSLAANLVNEDYIWRWESCIRDRKSPEHIKARFNQSTFFSLPVSTETLHRQEADFVPQSDSHVRIDRHILSLIDGRKSIGEIARQVLEQFPEFVADRRDAFRRVRRILKRYD